MWDNSEVIAIVQNEQYKGIMIQNKCETVGFGDNKKVRKRNKEDWSVVEGAIPRIVSDEMFDEVNKMLKRSMTEYQTAQFLVISHTERESTQKKNMCS